jgi:hypothetical protein
MVITMQDSKTGRFACVAYYHAIRQGSSSPPHVSAEIDASNSGPKTKAIVRCFLVTVQFRIAVPLSWADVDAAGVGAAAAAPRRGRWMPAASPTSNVPMASTHQPQKSAAWSGAASCTAALFQPGHSRAVVFATGSM